jgi:hypothetical protein
MVAPMPEAPLTLRLPFWLATRGFSLARLLADDPERSWTEGYRLLERFELSGPEQRFTLALMRRRTNLWIFRCHQRRFCGDFIVVDMSDPRPERRRVYCVELKQNAALVLDARGDSVQLVNHARAVDHVAQSTGTIVAGAPSRVVYGDPDQALLHFRAASL